MVLRSRLLELLEGERRESGRLVNNRGLVDFLVDGDDVVDDGVSVGLFLNERRDVLVNVVMTGDRKGLGQGHQLNASLFLFILTHARSR